MFLTGAGTPLQILLVGRDAGALTGSRSLQDQITDTIRRADKRLSGAAHWPKHTVCRGVTRDLTTASPPPKNKIKMRKKNDGDGTAL